MFFFFSENFQRDNDSSSERICIYRNQWTFEFIYFSHISFNDSTTYSNTLIHWWECPPSSVQRPLLAWMRQFVAFALYARVYDWDEHNSYSSLHSQWCLGYVGYGDGDDILKLLRIAIIVIIASSVSESCVLQCVNVLINSRIEAIHRFVFPWFVSLVLPLADLSPFRDNRLNDIACKAIDPIHCWNRNEVQLPLSVTFTSERYGITHVCVCSFVCVNN